MASIKDIAKELHLAVSTVSMALNDNPRIAEATRKLVQEKAREMKYVKNGAAVDLQKQKTNLILFVLYDASRSFFSQTIKELQSAVTSCGYDFIISTTYGGSDRTAIKYIREHRADAVIVYTKTVDDALLSECASDEFPIFVLGHKADTRNPYVRSFLYQEDVLPLPTAEYLIEKGHKRIGFVTGFAESYGTIRSYNGFKLSMKNHGLTVDPELIFDAKGSQTEDGYRVCEEQILSKISQMDGIIFSNDDVAVGAMKCFNDHNIPIPDTLSVIGNHNIPASLNTVPPLTTATILSDGKEAGYYKKLVQCLDSYIKQSPDRELEDLLSRFSPKAQIVERETVRDL